MRADFKPDGDDTAGSTDKLFRRQPLPIRPQPTGASLPTAGNISRRIPMRYCYNHCHLLLLV